jgi:hypothetical protein
MNLNEIKAYVMTRHKPPCRELSRWLFGHRLDWSYSSSEFGIDVARNQTVNRFLQEQVPKGKQYLMMIDADMVPVVDTHRIISADGDLVWCGYTEEPPAKGHYGEGDFGAACFRASASLLSRMQQPWFKMKYDGCLGRRLACECSYFAACARGQGVEPRMVGIIGHARRCIMFPTPETTLGWKICFPHELPYHD